MLGTDWYFWVFSFVSVHSGYQGYPTLSVYRFAWLENFGWRFFVTPDTIQTGKRALEFFLFVWIVLIFRVLLVAKSFSSSFRYLHSVVCYFALMFVIVKNAIYQHRSCNMYLGWWFLYIE